MPSENFIIIIWKIFSQDVLRVLKELNSHIHSWNNTQLYISQHFKTHRNSFRKNLNWGVEYHDSNGIGELLGDITFWWVHIFVDPSYSTSIFWVDSPLK